MTCNKRSQGPRTQEFNFVLRYKDLPTGDKISLERVLTNNPRTPYSGIQEGWNPAYDGTYELFIRLKHETESPAESGLNTHPKISWYLGQEQFMKLYDVIRTKEDLIEVNNALLEAIDKASNGLQHYKATVAAGGLIMRLSERGKK